MERTSNGPTSVGGYRASRCLGRLYMIPGGATLTPAGFIDDREAARPAVNACIGTSGRFDAVVDFDAVVRDPARPMFPLPADDSGDHVHFNVAGYRVLANSINLSLFRSRGVDR